MRFSGCHPCEKAFLIVHVIGTDHYTGYMLYYHLYLVFLWWWKSYLSLHLYYVQILLLVVNVLRSMYIPGHVGHWTETVIILPVSNWGLFWYSYFASLSLFSFIKDYRRNYTTNMSSSLPLIVKYWYSQMIYVDTNKNILYEFWYKNFIFFVFGDPFKVSFWKKFNIVSNLNCVVLFQINAILPLTPLFLPILWRMVNYYGQARVYAAFKVAKETKVTIVKFSKRYTL